ncbi:MAG: DinB family protein [Candidatus Sulfotelmatobacter sp.]
MRNEFARLLAEVAELANSPREQLDRQIEPSHETDKKLAGTLEAVLWQMVAHNSYHTGQIAMIRRALGVWPPRAGGHSW